MAYIDELLGQGEQIRYTGRQHTFVLVSNVLTELFLIAVLTAAGMVSQAAFAERELAGQPVGSLVFIVCVVISIMVLISAVLDYLRWNNEQYVITDHRVLQIRGILSKTVSDSSLEKINDVVLTQSWLGRMFDFGDIEIVTGSDIGVNLMQKIARPLEFKRTMMEAKQHYSRGFGYLDPQSIAAYMQSIDKENGADTQKSESSQNSIEETLRSLANLRDLGLLSAEEFEAKKRDLLSRI
jgi:uncharacterized membrane protein YdbT with pleckstrin-like domain